MHFLSRNNTFYSLFINVNPVLLYFLLFLSMSSIFSIWFFTFHARMNEKQIRLIADIEGLKQKENLLFKIRKEIESNIFEIQELNSQIDEVVNFHSKHNAENSINMLIKNSKALDLIVTGCNSDDYINKTYYDKNVISFNFKGSFAKIIDFFKKISTSKQWVKFKKLSLSNTADDQIQVESTYNVYIPKKGLKWQMQENFVS